MRRYNKNNPDPDIISGSHSRDDSDTDSTDIDELMCALLIDDNCSSIGDDLRSNSKSPCISESTSQIQPIEVNVKVDDSASKAMSSSDESRSQPQPVEVNMEVNDPAIKPGKPIYAEIKRRSPAESSGGKVNAIDHTSVDKNPNDDEQINMIQSEEAAAVEAARTTYSKILKGTELENYYTSPSKQSKHVSFSDFPTCSDRIPNVPKRNHLQLVPYKGEHRNFANVRPSDVFYRPSCQLTTITTPRVTPPSEVHKVTTAPNYTELGITQSLKAVEVNVTVNEYRNETSSDDEAIADTVRRPEPADQNVAGSLHYFEHQSGFLPDEAAGLSVSEHLKTKNLRRKRLFESDPVTVPTISERLSSNELRRQRRKIPHNAVAPMHSGHLDDNQIRHQNKFDPDEAFGPRVFELDEAAGLSSSESLNDNELRQQIELALDQAANLSNSENLGNEELRRQHQLLLDAAADPSDRLTDAELMRNLVASESIAKNLHIMESGNSPKKGEKYVYYRTADSERYLIEGEQLEPPLVTIPSDEELKKDAKKVFLVSLAFWGFMAVYIFLQRKEYIP